MTEKAIFFVLVASVITLFSAFTSFVLLKRLQEQDHISMFILHKSRDLERINIAITDQNSKLVRRFIEQEKLIEIKKDTIKTLEAVLTKRNRERRSLIKAVQRVNALEYETMKLRARLQRDWACDTCHYRMSFGNDLVPIPSDLIPEIAEAIANSCEGSQGDENG